MSKAQMKILQFRDLTERDLQFMRLLKPFEDHGDVIRIDHHDLAVDLALVLKFCHDQMSLDQHNFTHLLKNVTKPQVPSDVYQHLVALDEHWPTLIWYFVDEQGREMNFRQIPNYYRLQAVLALAQDRHLITTGLNLIGKQGGR